MTDNFGLGKLGFGSLAGMTDGLELMKRAWNPFNLPSTMTPTMDIDELDKRIADLKTVEQWLNVNLGMLRGTIQTMEIQRGTLAALREMGNSFTGAASAASPAAGDAAAQMFAAFTALQKSIGGIGQQQEPAPGATDAPDSGDGEAPPEGPAGASAQDRSAGMGAGSGAAASRGAGSPGAGAAEATARAEPAGSAGSASPSLWWDLLQKQFQQVAQAALAGSALSSPARPSASAAPAANSRAHAAAASRSSGAAGAAGASGTSGDSRTSGASSAAGAKRKTTPRTGR